MILYNIWFSFKNNAVESEELKKVAEFLLGYKKKNLVHDFKLLRNRAETGKTRLLPFQASISFLDNDQFSRPFQEVNAAGIHTGQHGLMIKNVDKFIIEVFDELPEV